MERGTTWHGIEIKAGKTVATDFFDGLDFWRSQSPKADLRPRLVYRGGAAQTRERGGVVSWNGIRQLLEAL